MQQNLWHPLKTLQTARGKFGLKAFCFLTTLAMTLLLVSACAPEVGSDEWCQDMREKPKGEWTTKEVSDYAKHCLFK